MPGLLNKTHWVFEHVTMCLNVSKWHGGRVLGLQSRNLEFDPRLV